MQDTNWYNGDTLKLRGGSISTTTEKNPDSNLKWFSRVCVLQKQTKQNHHDCTKATNKIFCSYINKLSKNLTDSKKRWLHFHVKIIVFINNWIIKNKLRLHLHSDRTYPELSVVQPTGVQEYLQLLCTCRLCAVLTLGEPGPIVYNRHEHVTSSWWHREAQKITDTTFLHRSKITQHSPIKNRAWHST